MKKTVRIIALLCAVCALLPLFSVSAAEPDAAQRGEAAIKATEHWDYIQLPKPESYLDEWKTRYARKAWYAPSLWVESVPVVNSGAPYRPFLFEGTEATVVAEENDMSCILYRGENNKLYSGWVKSIRLLDEFPGRTYNIGEKREGDFDTLPETPLSWSAGYLPGTEQRCTVLNEPVENCVGFEFEYQMIAENTAAKWMVMGPRTVWVSDGESWTALGQFPYPENGAVRVQVWLPEPMTVAAVATVAHCHAPNMFDFRQTARDFLIEKERSAAGAPTE